MKGLFFERVPYGFIPKASRFENPTYGLLPERFELMNDFIRTT